MLHKRRPGDRSAMPSSPRRFRLRSRNTKFARSGSAPHIAAAPAQVIPHTSATHIRQSRPHRTVAAKDIQDSHGQILALMPSRFRLRSRNTKLARRGSAPHIAAAPAQVIPHISATHIRQSRPHSTVAAKYIQDSHGQILALMPRRF